MSIRKITSPSNSHLRDAIKLRDGRARRKQRRFLIDGWREILRAAEKGLVPDQLFFTARSEPMIVQWYERTPLTEVSLYQLPESLMKALAYGQREDDIVATCELPLTRLASLSLPAHPLIVVLDQIEKPGNVGAVFRTADAVGADAVILADCAGDQFNPNAIRASSGTVFSVPSANDSAVAVIDYLTSHGITIVATRVDAEQTHWDCDWTGDIAIVIGNEARGISKPWRTSEIQGIRIPMAGIADSLNASITAAVCLYEAARQRR